MDFNQPSDREILTELARKAMLEHDLQPDFSPEARVEALQLQHATPQMELPGRDLRDLLWVSIDNDDSRDLDQLSVAELLPDGRVKILVAVADVTWAVKEDTAIDAHARGNTTTVYTPAVIFPMLPESLSTDLTSLNPDQDRPAMVIEMSIDPSGALQDANVDWAWVRNHAQLTYNGVSAWLDGKGPLPEAMVGLPGLKENLILQDQVAQKIKYIRQANGALTLETIEADPVFVDDQVRSMQVHRKNRAGEMIENFMIVANGVTARYLSKKGLPSIRRVVLAPERWDRIVALAAEHKEDLPSFPDSRALENFLVHQKETDPLRFPDLSLAVIKLLGAGQYLAEPPTDRIPDHFGLAARDYTHSTAPNRRYPDIITQRLVKAALAGLPSPYSLEQLDELAKHCTIAEDEANKVERQMIKSAVALLLNDKFGEQFKALVTGASSKGTWVRLIDLPVEGRLVSGFAGLDVGDYVPVKLSDVNIQQGHIDFVRAHKGKHR